MSLTDSSKPLIATRHDPRETQATAWLAPMALAVLHCNGVSPRLAHRLFRAFATENSSLVEEFSRYLRGSDRSDAQVQLEKEKFLRPRGSLPLDPANQVIGSILSSVLPPDIEPRVRAPLLYAHCMLSQWLAFRRSDAGAIEDIIGETRKVGTKRDSLVSASEAEHVLVLYRSRVLLLKMLDRGRVLPLPSVAARVERFAREVETHDATSLPILTALPKAQAAPGLDAARAARPEAMHAIDRALLVVSLACDLTAPDGRVDFAKGLAGTGLDRWFGKTNLVADERGHIGLYMDHAVADGELALRFVAAIQGELGRGLSSDRPNQSAGEAPGRVVRRFPERLEATWAAAIPDFSRQAARFSTAQARLEFDEGFSALVPASLPFACQAAFHRATGSLEEPYVPVSRSHIAERALEIVRGSAPGTRTAVRRLYDPGFGDRASLVRIVEWWRAAFLVARRGPGGERVLQHLFTFAETRDRHLDPFFRAAGYPERQAYPRLCLSIVPGQACIPGTVFPPVEDGWGVGAIVHDRGVNLAVSVWERDAAQALAEVETALRRMAAVMA